MTSSGIVPYPIELIKGDDRLGTLPIGRPNLWAYYKLAQSAVWFAEEIEMSNDRSHYEYRLTSAMRKPVDHILGFFATADRIVNINLAQNFSNEINILEATYFYDFQMTMENIHAETYANLLENIIPDPARREEVQNAAQTLPIVKKMCEYMQTAIDRRESFARRLLKFACVEGIFFTGCFCIIYWLSDQGLMPGLSQSNELISRDEALHTQFAMALYNMIQPKQKLTNAEVNEVVMEAVEIACEFTRAALPIPMPQMNSALMSAYIKCQGNIIVDGIWGDIPYEGATHYFSFMDRQNMAVRTNGFERKETSYSRPIDYESPSGSKKRYLTTDTSTSSTTNAALPDECSMSPSAPAFDNF